MCLIYVKMIAIKCGISLVHPVKGLAVKIATTRDKYPIFPACLNIFIKLIWSISINIIWPPWSPHLTMITMSETPGRWSLRAPFAWPRRQGKG